MVRFVLLSFIIVLSWTPSSLAKDEWRSVQINISQSSKPQWIEFVVIAGTISLDNITVDSQVCDNESESAIEKSRNKVSRNDFDELENWIENMTSSNGSVALKRTSKNPFQWYQWSSWSQWSDCIGTAPTSYRRRFCLGPASDVVQCRGERIEASRINCPTEVFQHGESEFLFFKYMNFTHKKANEFCCQLGGSLAKMHSRDHHYEMGTVLDKLQESASSGPVFHIGLRNRGNTWRWPDFERANDYIKPRRLYGAKLYEAWSHYKHADNPEYKCAALTSYHCHSTSVAYVTGRFHTCWIKVNCTSKLPFICERAFNPCSFSKCENGGTCIPNGKSYTCNCSKDYFGLRCQFERYPCLSLPCMNGGLCRSDNRSSLRYSCLCLQEFYGKNCELKLIAGAKTRRTEYFIFEEPQLTFAKSKKYCERFNGTLAMPNNRYERDTIFRGIKKQNNETYSQYFLGLRKKKGKWKWLDGGRSLLKYKQRYTGLCGTIASSECGKHWAKCFESWNCTTKNSFICQRTINSCSSPTCQNGGVCAFDTSSEHKCECPKGYKGRYCETEINPCTSLPCKNGGSCVEDPHTVFGYTCQCLDNFVGYFCELEKYPCLSSPCMHGGTCAETSTNFNRYFCVCPPHVSGINCEAAQEIKTDATPSSSVS